MKVENLKKYFMVLRLFVIFIVFLMILQFTIFFVVKSADYLTEICFRNHLNCKWSVYLEISRFHVFQYLFIFCIVFWNIRKNQTGDQRINQAGCLLRAQDWINTNFTIVGLLAIAIAVLEVGYTYVYVSALLPGAVSKDPLRGLPEQKWRLARALLFRGGLPGLSHSVGWSTSSVWSESGWITVDELKIDVWSCFY